MKKAKLELTKAIKNAKDGNSYAIRLSRTPGGNPTNWLWESSPKAAHQELQNHEVVHNIVKGLFLVHQLRIQSPWQRADPPKVEKQDSTGNGRHK